MLCNKKETPKRKHWCNDISILCMLNIMSIYNAPIYSSDLIDFIIDEANPLRMSKSRSAEMSKSFVSDEIIVIKPDPIDPRKYYVVTTEKGLKKIHFIKTKYREKLKELALKNTITANEYESQINYLKEIHQKMKNIVMKTGSKIVQKPSKTT